MCLSKNGEKPKTTLVLSNTQATKESRELFKIMYIYGKVIQCHSNHSPELLELKKKSNKEKQITLFKHFLCDIL